MFKKKQIRISCLTSRSRTDGQCGHLIVESNYSFYLTSTDKE